MVYAAELHRWIRSHRGRVQAGDSGRRRYARGSRAPSPRRERIVSVHATDYGTWEVKYRVGGRQRSKIFKTRNWPAASTRT